MVPVEQPKSGKKKKDSTTCLSRKRKNRARETGAKNESGKTKGPTTSSVGAPPLENHELLPSSSTTAGAGTTLLYYPADCLYYPTEYHHESSYYDPYFGTAEQLSASNGAEQLSSSNNGLSIGGPIYDADVLKRHPKRPPSKTRAGRWVFVPNGEGGQNVLNSVMRRLKSAADSAGEGGAEEEESLEQ